MPSHDLVAESVPTLPVVINEMSCRCLGKVLAKLGKVMAGDSAASMDGSQLRPRVGNGAIKRRGNELVLHPAQAIHRHVLEERTQLGIGQHTVVHFADQVCHSGSTPEAFKQPFGGVRHGRSQGLVLSLLTHIMLWPLRGDQLDVVPSAGDVSHAQ